MSKTENNKIICFFLINELYPNYNENPYEEFNNKKPIGDNSLNKLNTSCSNIDINEDEEEKYIPSTLLDLSREKSKKIEDNDEIDNKFINELDINSKPFFPKNKLYKIINQHNQVNNNNNNSNNKCQKINNKKKKKMFCIKKGDWVCYDCKNLNFCFRDKCNRCELDKEESEQKYIDAGKTILCKLNDQLFNSI